MVIVKKILRNHGCNNQNLLIYKIIAVFMQNWLLKGKKTN